MSTLAHSFSLNGVALNCLLGILTTSALAGTAMMTAPIEGKLHANVMNPKAGQELILNFTGKTTISDATLKFVLIKNDCLEVVEGPFPALVEKTTKNKMIYSRTRIRVLNTKPCTAVIQVISHESTSARMGSIFAVALNKSNTDESTRQIKGKNKSNQATIEVETGSK
jgi:hypothetical protein